MGSVACVLVQIQPKGILAERSSFGSRSFAPSSRVDSEQGFTELLRASCLAGGLVSARLDRTKMLFSEDFSQLESVGVSNNCVFNSITEFLCVFAVYVSKVTGEYKAV